MKKYILIICLISLSGFSQAQKKPSQDWYQEKVSKKNFGIDLKRAYSELIKNDGKQIIVAVIDGGTDISHPDLKANIWRNPEEISNNGIDDDNNGYVDDTAGWNFIGGRDGKMVEFDNLEKTRILRKLMKEYEEVDAEVINSNDSRREKYEFYQKLKIEIEEQKANYQNNLNIYKSLKKGMGQIKYALNSADPSRAEIEAYDTKDNDEAFAKSVTLNIMKNGKKSFQETYKSISEQYDQIYGFVNYHYSVDYDPRDIVGDNYNDANEKFYGNNDVAGPDPSHGTHVAGIIAAVRGNNIGVEGVADNVKIMVVRVVPDGDERDKDVANGIRYATDNGAKIINMSFGKGYTWDKGVVDAAVAYAVSKGVLMIHAAGNSSEDNDVAANYPNDSLPANNFAATWFEIGASAPDKSKLATDFSNYGKNNVDVFSPGFQIYSTTPRNNYESFDGTSMAAPVTAGVAALVWSHYPNLTALQVKEILMKSAVVNPKKVTRPGTKNQKVKFTDLSVSGGVVNAYNALKLAATY